ncbi:Putative PPPDE peptidase domain-containing protein [Septoria linicola]|uniref:PPPDE peptidase domain-containing protein n=1 Tax=Septoria linicola TaxID=215465 RepID=A0A9Q9AH47_9PEZI|nr:Putative PPPDE peptidase domain-containing protein [Septoria linicola]
MASSSKPKPSRTRIASSTSSRRSSSTTTSSTTKTPIYINIYDLLPPGRLSSLLWTLGSSLLHSGVVIPTLSLEFAFGGHNKPLTTGVYSTPPAYAPPGSTHRSSILAGFSAHSPSETEDILKDIGEKFLGPRYNLLTNNCNHFTSALVLALTGKAAPGWLNRAAGIGLALPCVVPREWISPPDVDTAEGELLAEDDEEEEEEEEDDDVIARAVYKDHDDGEEDEEDVEADERASMLESERHRRLRDEQRRQREVELRSRREAQQQRQGSGSGTKRLSVASINRSMSLAGSAVTTSTGRNSSIEQCDDDDDNDVVGQSLAGGKRITTVDEPPARLVKRVDSAGRELPVAERAPVPKAATVAAASSRT